jgi:hypothetical protein
MMNGTPAHPHDQVMQILGEPPVSMLREHGVVMSYGGLVAVCVPCKDKGRLTVLRSGERVTCGNCLVRVRRSRAEFCPCGGRLDDKGRCENGCEE